jgi:hypothetical protein
MGIVALSAVAFVVGMLLAVGYVIIRGLFK